MTTVTQREVIASASQHNSAAFFDPLPHNNIHVEQQHDRNAAQHGMVYFRARDVHPGFFCVSSRTELTPRAATGLASSQHDIATIPTLTTRASTKSALFATTSPVDSCGRSVTRVFHVQCRGILPRRVSLAPSIQPRNGEVLPVEDRQPGHP